MYKSTPGSGKVINPQYKEWLKEERKRQTLLRRADKQAKKEREREKKAQKALVAKAEAEEFPESTDFDLGASVIVHYFGTQVNADEED